MGYHKSHLPIKRPRAKQKSFHLLLFLWPHLSGSKNIACQSVRLTAGFLPALGPGNQNKGSHVRVCPRCTLCCTNGPEPWRPGLVSHLRHMASSPFLQSGPLIPNMETCRTLIPALQITSVLPRAHPKACFVTVLSCL